MYVNLSYHLVIISLLIKYFIYTSIYSILLHYLKICIQLHFTDTSDIYTEFIM